MKDSLLHELIERYYSGETSSTEEEQIYEELSRRPDLGRFESEWAIFQLLEQNRNEEPSADFEKNLAEKIAALPDDVRVRKLNRFSLIGVAASLLLLLTFYLLNEKNWFDGQQEISTMEERRKVVFPDGSTVWLNKNSILNYPKSFGGDNRRVTLQGEGYFDVVRDSEHPFIIETGQTLVEVVGTSFNVRDYRKEGMTQIAVNTGTLRVTLIKNLDEGILLKRNEIATHFDGDQRITKMAANDLSGTEILIKAFQKIEENYVTESNTSSGFFRETFTEDGETVFLVEAAVDVLDPGFELVEEEVDMPQETVHLRQVRKSNDYLRNEVKHNLEQFNSLAGVLKWNRVKYLDQNLPRRLEDGQYRLDSVVQLQSNMVYAITYSEHTKQMDYHDVYYVDIRSFAIRKYEKRASAKPGFYLDNQFQLTNDSSYSFRLKEDHTSYEFSEHEGKLFLSYGGGQGTADIIQSGDVMWELGINRLLVMEEEQDDHLEQPIPMNLKRNLNLQTTPYDGQFWNNYRLLIDNPLTNKEIQELEKKSPLEEQFRKQ